MGGLGGEAWKEPELEWEWGMWEPKREEGRRGLQRGAGPEMERSGGEDEELGTQERSPPFGGRKLLEFFIEREPARMLSIKARAPQRLGRSHREEEGQSGPLNDSLFAVFYSGDAVNFVFKNKSNWIRNN